MYCADRVSLRTLNARIVDAMSLGSLACVSRESHTPKTKEVGAIFARGTALPFEQRLEGVLKCLLKLGAANDGVARP